MSDTPQADKARAALNGMDRESPEIYQNPEAFHLARKALGMTQTEFAAALGLAEYNSIRRYETEKRSISGPLARLVWFLMKYGVPESFRKEAPNE